MDRQIYKQMDIKIYRQMDRQINKIQGVDEWRGGGVRVEGSARKQEVERTKVRWLRVNLVSKRERVTQRYAAHPKTNKSAVNIKVL